MYAVQSLKKPNNNKKTQNPIALTLQHCHSRKLEEQSTKQIILALFVVMKPFGDRS